MSVNGAEEDGVDNRVEAPAWAPNGGSDGAAADPQSGETTSPSADSSDPSAESSDTAGPESVPSGGGSESASKPRVSKGATAAAESDPAERPGQDGRSPSAAQPLATSAPLPGPVFAAAAAVSPTPLPAAGVGTATAGAARAGAARGFAAKVSSPFSGLTKPKPKGKTQQKRPAGNGQSARPIQGVRPQARLTEGQRTGLQSRRAQLRLERIEPLSVMKFSLLISLVGWVILVVMVAVLYFALSKLGVFTSIEHTVGLVTTSKSNPVGSNAASWFKASRILGYTILVGFLNVILMTALATIGAVLYNLVTVLSGGIEVTLKESD